MSGFDDRDGLIWFDGEWVDWRDAKVHVLTHTLHYGMGVFEGVRAYQTDNGPQFLELKSIRIGCLILPRL
jgi:branched chain amino acid aminotransferase apoenzyme (EC 2.6.1.42)